MTQSKQLLSIAGKNSPVIKNRREAELQYIFLRSIFAPGKKGQTEMQTDYLREFYPKGMDFSQIDEELKYYLELMNNRPRKCLGYKTPNEIIYEINAH